MSNTVWRERDPLALTPGRMPAFTLGDMRAFLLSAPRCVCGPTLSGEPPTILSLAFVGCRELRDRLDAGLWIGLPDDALVCYTLLRGPFLMTGMSLPPGHKGPTPFSNLVGEIYDARSGRLLVQFGVAVTREDHYRL